MAKLTPEQLAEGRKAVAAGDVRAFRAWHIRHFPMRDLDGQALARFQDQMLTIPELSLMVFDRFYPNEDPSGDVREIAVKLIAVLVVGFGLLGGIIYLARMVVP